MRKGVLIVENRFSVHQIQRHLLGKVMKHLPNEEWNFLIIRNKDINSLSDYNRLMTNADFWRSIPFDIVLIVQMDAEMLRPGIEEFLQYDFVGAPWKFQQHGGNGGFSLRSVQKMLDVIEYFPYQGESNHGYEDVYYSNHIHKVGGQLAPRDVCRNFACETIFELGTLGVHAIDKYLTKEQCEQIREAPHTIKK